MIITRDLAYNDRIRFEKKEESEAKIVHIKK